MKSIYRILSLLIVLYMLFCLGGCGSDKEEKAGFALYKSSFEVLNDYFLDYYNQAETKDESVGFYFEADGSSGLVDHFYGGFKGEYIYPDEEILAAVNDVGNFFTQSFDYIRVSSDRISYSGEGSQMIVWTADGQKPKYFSSADETDTPSFSVTFLGDNWWYLYLRVR